MTCYICGGTGKRACSHCGGTGTMTTTAHGVNGYQSISSPCPACAGSGFQRCNCGSRGSANFRDLLYHQPTKFKHNEIVPFEHINGIIPRETSFSAVTGFFGKPDICDELMYDGWGSPIYKRYGIMMIVEGGIVKSVTAVDPFLGETANGLYLGMSMIVAKLICDKEYIRANEGVEDVWIYRHTDKAGRFTLGINDCKLSAMTVGV